MNFIKRKWAWAKQKPLFWASVILVIATVLLLSAYAPPLIDGAQSDLRLRLWAMALQLMGAYTVWLDLTATARNFGKTGVFLGTIQWLQSGIFGRTITISAAAACMSTASLSARIKVSRPITPGSPIEERLATLEYNYKLLDSEVDTALNTIRDNHSETKRQFKDQAEQTQAKIDAAAREMAEGFTGNHGVLAFGIFWLCIGIVFASIAPELAKLSTGNWRAVWNSI